MPYFKLDENNHVYEVNKTEVGAVYMDSDLFNSTIEGLNWNLDKKYLNKLRKTDWKVTRHRDQLALGTETSLTQEKYQKLLKQRQAWRDNYIGK